MNRLELRRRLAILRRVGVPDGRWMKDGTVLAFSIRYDNSHSGYTYVAIKEEGAWYLTGVGKVPRQAGWAVVEKWLTEPGRILIRAEIAEWSVFRSNVKTDRPRALNLYHSVELYRDVPEEIEHAPQQQISGPAHRELPGPNPAP